MFPEWEFVHVWGSRAEDHRSSMQLHPERCGCFIASEQLWRGFVCVSLRLRPGSLTFRPKICAKLHLSAGQTQEVSEGQNKDSECKRCKLMCGWFVWWAAQRETVWSCAAPVQINWDFLFSCARCERQLRPGCGRLTDDEKPFLQKHQQENNKKKLPTLLCQAWGLNTDGVSWVSAESLAGIQRFSWD